VLGQMTAGGTVPAPAMAASRRAAAATEPIVSATGRTTDGLRQPAARSSRRTASVRPGSSGHRGAATT